MNSLQIDVRIEDDLILSLRSELQDGLASEWGYVAVNASASAGPMLMIDEFLTRLSLACEKRDKNQKYIVISTGNDDAQAITTASMLLGSFLILRRGHSVDAVFEVFQAVCEKFVPLSFAHIPDDEVTVQDCWLALHRALLLSWFVQPSSDDEPMMDVDELAHYSQSANGGVQIVVPGALLLFPTPSDDVPDGQEWADSVCADGRTVRHFSAGYYASLLADLGVSAAACLSRGSPASARALAEHGVAPSDLRLPGPAHGAGSCGAGALLPALDRLLTLVRGAPGAVAVHGDSICGWSRTALGTLAMAVLMSRFGFSGREAAAWVHMVACC